MAHLITLKIKVRKNDLLLHRVKCAKNAFFSCLEHVYMEMEHCEFQEILPLAQNYICYC